MLTGWNVAILGGDARQIEMIRKLSEWDASLHLIGFDQLDYGFTGANHIDMDDEEVEKFDVVILPVAGTDENGNIDSIFSNQQMALDEDWVTRTKDDCIFLTGIANKYLTDLMDKTDRRLVPLLSRDDVAIYNSVPTVEGAIMMVIQNTDFTIHSSRVHVLGLGRVGMSVARAFHGLGAKVHVGVRKPAHYARVQEMGLVPFYLNNLEKNAENSDIMINTIPAPIINASVIRKMPSHTFILDLASKPGGTDFRYAEKRGIKAIIAPSLPGIVAPKTAGRILANTVSQILKDYKRKDGESK
ncbi:dipicolinate synthase subunit A [Thalassobacillus devorans]|uniref:Dipicolinate synthase subunit A n=1 Tax=Thalassobacillus devorans TaxID=279813 RepID=A0ABQ1P6C4_9BACI|nr:dipicolinic acid synthetase subunit A [Thalassobacillus devorans]NIK27960.1 dipicolinate synthase subunit A [Thalassobacillus devorans]GGC90029.1 dipicolinate synthase subunit A [Thalassobacillus devorans]